MYKHEALSGITRNPGNDPIASKYAAVCLRRAHAFHIGVTADLKEQFPSLMDKQMDEVIPVDSIHPPFPLTWIDGVRRVTPVQESPSDERGLYCTRLGSLVIDTEMYGWKAICFVSVIHSEYYYYKAKKFCHGLGWRRIPLVTFLRWHEGDEYGEIIYDGDRSIRNYNEEDIELLKEYADLATTTASLALMMINCKNIEPVVVRRGSKRQRKSPPDTKKDDYYVLHLRESCARSGSGMKEGPEGLVRLHHCRGHFATYTSEAPLFGKHVGTYWVPAHMRGNRKRGEIIKDYDLSKLSGEKTS